MSKPFGPEDPLKHANALAQMLGDKDFMTACLAGQDSSMKIGNLAADIATIFNALDSSMSFASIDDAMGRGDGGIRALADSLGAAYGASRALIMPHGSSLSNVLVALAVRAHLGRRPRVAVDRGCHGSASGGFTLADAEVVWMDRPYNTDLRLQLPFKARDLEVILEKIGNVDAIWMTNPSYDGFLATDMAAVRDLCKKRGCLLIIDAAWGGYEGLLEAAGYPPSPASYGDIAIISTHKKGIGVSGNSVILVSNLNLLSDLERIADLGIVSTSPPFVTYLVLEQALKAWQSDEGIALARRMIIEGTAFRTAMEQLPGIKSIRAEDLGPGYICDPSHILFNTEATGMTGYAIQEGLSAGFAIDAEKATLQSLLFLFGPDQCDSWERVVAAVNSVLKRGPWQNIADLPPPPPPLRQQKLSMQAALFGLTVNVEIDRAVGRVAAQSVAAYPPGSGIIQPGEVITEEAIAYLLALETQGSRLKGVAGRLMDVGLRVVENINPSENTQG